MAEPILKVSDIAGPKKAFWFRVNLQHIADRITDDPSFPRYWKQKTFSLLLESCDRQDIDGPARTWYNFALDCFVENSPPEFAEKSDYFVELFYEALHPEDKPNSLLAWVEEINSRYLEGKI